MIKMKQYKCMVCGKLIDEDKGITTLNGLWVCDEDTCRTLDVDSQAIEKKVIIKNK
jgi:ribosomal protein S26